MLYLDCVHGGSHKLGLFFELQYLIWFWAECFTSKLFLIMHSSIKSECSGKISLLSRFLASATLCMPKNDVILVKQSIHGRWSDSWQDKWKILKLDNVISLSCLDIRALVMSTSKKLIKDFFLNIVVMMEGGWSSVCFIISVGLSYIMLNHWFSWLLSGILQKLYAHFFSLEVVSASFTFKYFFVF